MTVYGIKNCNTVKSALDWLKKKKIEFEFHDYKSKGVSASKLKEWHKQVGWEALVNKKGMTWRKLDEKAKSKVTNLNAAIELMTSQTSVIKRPLIEVNGRVVALGFDEGEYKKVIK
ncbi:MAG: ArsC family reductase [Cyclobacteriaceae bacterium]